VSSPADYVGGSFPLGTIISLFSAIPSGGSGSEGANPYAGAGSMEDPYGSMQPVEEFFGGGVLPPPSVADVPYATPPLTTNPIGIPSPSTDPGPFYPPTQRTNVPGPEDPRAKIERLRREAERLRSNTRNKRPPPKKPPGGGRGVDPLGDYATIARACIANPVACIAGGVLFPSEIGDSTLTKEEIRKVAAQRKRNIFAKEPLMPKNVVSKQKMPRLVLAGESPLAKLETPKSVKITAKRMPVEKPKAVKITAKRMPAIPATATPPSFWKGLGSAILSGTNIQGLLLELAKPKARTESPILAVASPTPTQSPTPTIPGLDPLTPVSTPGVASPLAGGYFGFSPPRSGTLEDQCRQIRKRKKPKRRCVKRDDCNRCIEFEPI